MVKHGSDCVLLEGAATNAARSPRYPTLQWIAVPPLSDHFLMIQASHKEMESYVNVGDMVLFSNGGFGPTCIQCWTRSEFGAQLLAPHPLTPRPPQITSALWCGL